METFASFNEKILALDEEIKRHYASFPNEESTPVWDGIVDEEEYYKSDIKILWILKEPYDKDNEGKGGWNLAKKLGTEEFLKDVGGAKTTWHPIIYTTYSILNGFTPYDDMEFIDKDPSMANVLRKIAFINVQKFPAGTTSINSDISAAYYQHKEILLKQINTYGPTIVIGGNTMWNFVKDLGSDGHHQHLEIDYWVKDRLYIDAYHPAYPKNDDAKEAYVDEIVTIAKKYIEKE